MDRCLSFINCGIHAPRAFFHREANAIKCITVSRQSGCGAHAFGIGLSAYLQQHLPGGMKPWTLFDRDLVSAVLEDHHMPARLGNFMPEDRVSQLNDIIEDLFSLHPPSEMLVRRTSETILRLAEMGNVIIVGRGANIVTARMPGMLHLRLISSLEKRSENMQRFEGLSRRAALARIATEDRGRRRYVKKYFARNIDDPLLYHLVINTELLELKAAVRMVGDLVVSTQPAMRE